MKIETIENNDTNSVDVKFNGTTHYDVCLGTDGWIVSECGYSGRELRSSIDSKARAVAFALQSLATDILENDWAEEHHSEPYSVVN